MQLQGGAVTGFLEIHVIKSYFYELLQSSFRVLIA